MMPVPQLPRSCPRCLARLGPGRDIPGCLQCGWEDYDQMETGVGSLTGSPLSELAIRGQRWRRPGDRRKRKTT